jgi:glutathione S-transferase
MANVANERDELVLYTNPMSRGRIAHWMVEEVGAPYRIEWLDLDKGEHKTPAYLAINPMGKVPTIVHRGVVVTEAAGICAYLADAFPKAGLAPALDSRERGTYVRWLFFAAACIESAVLDHRVPRSGAPEPRALGYGTYKDTLDTLESALKPGPYVLGERFSAADVYIGAQIGWCLQMKALEPRPTFLAYVERLQARPAQQRLNEQCNAAAQKLKHKAAR